MLVAGMLAACQQRLSLLLCHVAFIDDGSPDEVMPFWGVALHCSPILTSRYTWRGRLIRSNQVLEQADDYQLTDPTESMIFQLLEGTSISPSQPGLNQ